MHADDHGTDRPGSGADTAGEPPSIEARIEQALTDTPLPAYGSPEPERQLVLGEAYARADRRGATGHAAGGRSRWGTRALIAAAIVVAAVATAAVMLWPLRLNNGVEGVGLEAAAAWAATEGCVIELDLAQLPPEPDELEALVPGITADIDVVLELPDEQMAALGLNAYPGLVFHRALTRWNAEHSPPDGGPVLRSTQLTGQHSQFIAGGGIISSVALVLLNDDRELLAEVLAMLDTLPGISPPRVYRETLYLNEKYPEIYAPARKVIVNDRELRYPVDIDERYVETLHMMFAMLDRERVYYRAFWTTLSRERGGEPLVTGDVLRIGFNEAGDMLIDTVVETWNPPGEHVQASLSFDPRDTSADFDVLAELTKRLEQRQAQARGESGGDSPRYTLTIELIPLKRMLAPAAERLTEAELAQTRQVYRDIQQAFSDWYSGVDEFRDPTRRDRRARLHKPKTFGEGVVSATASLVTGDADQLAELRGLLEMASGVRPTVSSVDRTELALPVEGYVVEYEQLYHRNPAGSACSGASARKQLLDALSSWLDDYNSGVEEESREITIAELRDVDIWHGWHKCTAALIFPASNPALIDSLSARLRDVPGVAGPSVTAREIYFSPVNPEPFLPGRKVVIDGVEYGFPQDFSAREWGDLTSVIKSIRDQTWYRANWRLGVPGGAAGETRHPFGDVVMLRLDQRGDLVINTLVDDYEALVADTVAQGLMQPVPEGAIARSVEVRIAPEGAAADCDPLALLIEKSRSGEEGRGGIRGGDQPFYRIKFPLLPQERWTATGAMRLGNADLIAAREMEQRMRRAFDEWFAGQPQLHGDALMRHGAALHFWRIGEMAFCANLQLFTDEPALKDELVGLLITAGSGLAPDEECYPGR